MAVPLCVGMPQLTLQRLHSHATPERCKMSSHAGAVGTISKIKQLTHLHAEIRVAFHIGAYHKSRSVKPASLSSLFNVPIFKS